jgi:hypothetical protein
VNTRNRISRVANTICAPSPSPEADNLVIKAPYTFVMPATANHAWASWLGSQQAVQSLREKLLKIKIPVAMFSRAELLQMPPGLLFSTLLMNEFNYRLVGDELGADAAKKLHPLMVVNHRVREHIGADAFERIELLICSGNTSLITREVARALPQMGEVFEIGGFSTAAARSALLLRATLDACNEKEPKSRQYVVDMMLHLLSEGLCHSTIRSCIAHENPRLRQIFKAVWVPDGIDPRSPIFGSVPAVTAGLMASTLAFAFSARATTESPLQYRLGSVEALMLASSVESRILRDAIACMIAEANKLWLDLRSALEELGLREQSKIMRVDLPGQLLDPSLAEGIVHSIEVLKASKNFDQRTRKELRELSGLAPREDIGLVLSNLEDVRRQITAVAAEMPPSAFERLKELGERGSALTQRAVDMRAVITERMLIIKGHAKQMVTRWVEVAGASAKANEPAAPAPILPKTQEEPQVQAKAELVKPDQDEMVLDLMTRNEQLTQENRSIKADLHRLNLALDALKMKPAKPVADSVDAAFAELSRKVLLNEKLSPEEIMCYFSFLGADRIEFLDSAWKSARDSQHFAHSDRLFAMLQKLIFPFLDDVLSGRPMIQAARQQFSGAFSAKESETVHNDVRLRSQREFEREGRTLFFEAHLKVANGWGCVDGMRLYFDVIDGKVVVAYVGAHLDVQQTN